MSTEHGVSEADITEASPGTVDLETAVAVLRRDFGKALKARVQSLTHEVVCDLEGVSLRVHYPKFCDGDCSLQDLVDVISLYIAPFALPRAEVEEVQEQYGKVSADEYDAIHTELHNRAIDLFKKAQRCTKRNGEAGELLLCLLTEWILDAPQLLAKMSLKTNTEMPVHGADGVHVRFCSDTKRLIFFWGESKLYQKISDAIEDAAKSIATALQPEKIKHEISLVRRYIAFSGLGAEAESAIKAYLNPFKSDSTERVNVTTCLIGFDFKGYVPKESVSIDDIEEAFQAELNSSLAAWAGTIAEAFKAKGLGKRRVEIFLFPLPSVKTFRQMFQQKIGWSLPLASEAAA